MTRALLIVALILLALPALAGEQINLTTPVTTPSVTHWTTDEVHLRWSAQRIDVRFLGSNGEEKRCMQTGPAAVTAMVALNKADMRTNTLHRRAIAWAQGIGCIGAGSVTGSPD